MKKTILLLMGFLLVLPAVSMATEATTTSATTTKSVLETVQKDEKREEIRKQLRDTIDLCAALVNKIQNLEDRMMERISILVSRDNFSKEAQDQITLKQKKLDEVLASADSRVNGNLVKLAETVMNASKPTKSVSAFKKEVNNVKAEIRTTHKLIIEMIDLIKKETAKFEMKTEKDTSD